MEPSAIAMMIFGLAVTWGGAAICLTIATRRKDQDETADN